MGRQHVRQTVSAGHDKPRPIGTSLAPLVRISRPAHGRASRRALSLYENAELGDHPQVAATVEGLIAPARMNGVIITAWFASA